MPIYTIQLADGRKIDVQASNRNDALAEANDYAASNPRQKPNYTPPKRKMDTSANLQTLVTQGVTFGQSPRITGAMGTIMGVPDAIRQRSFAPIGEAYRQNRQAEIDRIDNARSQTGLLGAGAEMIGGLATGGAIAKAGGQLLARVAPKAAPRVAAALAPRAGSAGGKVARATGRTLAAAGGGAIAGGVYGSGEGRAAENAAYGAAGAVIAKPVAGAIGEVGKRLVNKFGPNVIPADRAAARALLDQVNEFGEARVVSEFNRLRAAGIRNPTLAEVVPGIARRVGSVARNDMDGARALARQRAGGMVGDVPILAQQAAKKLSRRGGTVATRQAQMATRKRAIQNNMMTGIQGQSAEITPAAAGALRTSNLSRPMQSAENNLRTIAEATSTPALNTEANLLRALREGEQSSGPRQFNLGTVEALRRQISGAEKAALEKADQKDLAGALGLTRRALTDPVRRQFPEYDRTLKVGEAFNRERDAMNRATGAGNKAGLAWDYKVPTEDVSNELAKMSGRELRGYRQGAAESLASNFNDNRINLSLLEALGGRGLTQERVAAQFPVNRMQDLANTSNALVNRMETARTVNPNFGSQTAGNQATDAMASVEGFLSLPAGKVGMAQQAMKWLARSASGLTPAERVAIVDLSTKPITGDVADEILRLTQRAFERQGGKGLPMGMIGAAGGVAVGGQINASGRVPEYQQ